MVCKTKNKMGENNYIPMKLKMYLENIFIDQIEINFINKETVEERQKYL